MDDSSHKFDEQDFLVLPIVEEIAGVVHCKLQVAILTPHDRVQQRTAECMVDVPLLQDGDAGDTGETVRMGA